MYRQYHQCTIKLNTHSLNVLADRFVESLKHKNHPEISIWNRLENILCGISKDKEYPAFNDTTDIFFSELIGVASGVYLLKEPEKDLLDKRAAFLKSINLI